MSPFGSGCYPTNPFGKAIGKAIYDIYSSAVLRDTVKRYNIRDVELLERVVKYVFDNVGNSFSAKSVADYFKSGAAEKPESKSSYYYK